jgi:hypothetical protein
MPLGDLQETSMTLQLTDRTYRKHEGILVDVPVIVEKCAYPIDFVVLEMDYNAEAIILGRPFLATAGALIDVKGASLTLRFGEEKVMFDMRHSTHIPQGHDTCNRIDTMSQCLTQVFGSEKELSSPKCRKVKPDKEMNITPLYSITQLVDNEGKKVLREEQR